MDLQSVRRRTVCLFQGKLLQFIQYLGYKRYKLSNTEVKFDDATFQGKKVEKKFVQSLIKLRNNNYLLIKCNITTSAESSMTQYLLKT